MRRRSFQGPTGPFRGSITVPGDKSLSHRALILGAMASAASRIANLAPGLDVASTASGLSALGAGGGGGVEAWHAPSRPLDCGNSGTTMRLLAGAAAGRPFETVLVGDPSLMRRPMQRLVGPLGSLGAVVRTSDGTPPLRVSGGNLAGADVVIDRPSAQVRTAVALAAIQASGVTRIDSPPGFRDHTESLLEALGLGRRIDGTAFEVVPGDVPALDIDLPGDTSSAAFLWAAAAICPGASVSTPGVSLNPGRVGFLSVLADMGATVSSVVTGTVLGDPVGDVTVAHAPLTAGRISGRLATACIDELPLVAVVAAFADGETVVADAAELRGKESDRIGATVRLVRSLGGTAEEGADGFIVGPGRLGGGVVDAMGDHRIAMAAAVAASAGGRVEVDGFEVAAVSWPGFAEVLEGMWSSP